MKVMLSILAINLLFLPLGILSAEEKSRAEVIKIETTGKIVASEIMRKIYEEVKTPYKYDVILKGKEGEYVDCPSVFRYGDKWYMVYIIFDGRGYETALACSDDLLKWTVKGKILTLRQNTWDANQVAGYAALQDTRWGGSYKLLTHDDKYWISYIGGADRGYEAGKLSIGLAWSKTPERALEWSRLQENPILSSDQPDARKFENWKLYKSNIICDKEARLGYPYVMYYNARGEYESIGMAVSKDMKTWIRFGMNPVVDYGDGITGDPQIQRINNVWVMFYFRTAGKVIDTFACSYDLVHWTKWTGKHLVEPTEPWDNECAHKPWVIKHEGVVYHFYCAVGDQGRVIALATSRDLCEKLKK